VKAGANAALASLWPVNDAATSMLMANFYRQLQNPAVNKARALQTAQQGLLTNSTSRHPFYWSAFMLIGNWL
jgi:CHAT domain-containing protein